MKSYRIFVEKYPEFRVEAESLLRDLNANLNLSLDGLRLLNVYDLFGFSDELLEKSRYRVFGEVVTDAVTDSCDLGGNSFLAVECLPSATRRCSPPSSCPDSSTSERLRPWTACG